MPQTKTKILIIGGVYTAMTLEKLLKADPALTNRCGQ